MEASRRTIDELISLGTRLGYRVYRSKGGRRVQLRHPETGRLVSMPRHIYPSGTQLPNIKTLIRRGARSGK